MIKKWTQFIREFVESDSYINAKMTELQDLIGGFGDDSIIYNWINNEDGQLIVNFSYNTLIIKYEFNTNGLFLIKKSGEIIDFKNKVDSIDEGLEIIEKDICSILGIAENLLNKLKDSIIKSPHYIIKYRVKNYTSLDQLSKNKSRGIILSDRFSNTYEYIISSKDRESAEEKFFNLWNKEANGNYPRPKLEVISINPIDDKYTINKFKNKIQTY